MRQNAKLLRWNFIFDAMREGEIKKQWKQNCRDSCTACVDLLLRKTTRGQVFYQSLNPDFQVVGTWFWPHPFEGRTFPWSNAGDGGLRDKLACRKTLEACLLTGLCEDTSRRILYSPAISTKTQPEHHEWRPSLALPSSVHVKKGPSVRVLPRAALITWRPPRRLLAYTADFIPLRKTSVFCRKK